MPGVDSDELLLSQTLKQLHEQEWASAGLAGHAQQGLIGLSLHHVARHLRHSGLDVTVDGKGAGRLDYAVAKTDARFRSLQIDVAGAGLSGRLDAFARPQPPVPTRTASARNVRISIVTRS